ncbi:MAG: DUF4293 family protein [Chitinophagaceae bacterium]
MIQRRQTIYLALIVILAGLAIIFNLKISSFNGLTEGVKTQVSLGLVFPEFKTEMPVNGGPAVNIKQEGVNTPILITFLVMAVLTIISIFQFKNLQLQKKMLTLNYVVMVLLFFFVYYTHIQLIKTFTDVTEAKFEWTRVLLVLFPSFNYLAINHIKKDIELLASVDRLR